MTRPNSIRVLGWSILVFTFVAPATQSETLRVRLTGWRIEDDAPIRQDEQLNKPPKIYVVAKRDDDVEFTTSSVRGWRATFRNIGYEFNVRSTGKGNIVFELFDSQWGTDPQIASVPLAARDLAKRLLSDSETGEGAKRPFPVPESPGVVVELQYVGRVRWYRLQKADIPEGARIRREHSTPYLFVRLYRDGEPLPNAAGKETSTGLPLGWSGTFPRRKDNLWMLLHASEARYDVELWDSYRRNELLMKVSDLKGEDFARPISTAKDFERLDELEREEHATITFVEDTSPAAGK